jgi:hypothetical protein
MASATAPLTAAVPPREPEQAPPPPPAVAAPVRAEPDRPESEDAYLRELMRLRGADPVRALALARKGDDWYPSVGRAAEARKDGVEYRTYGMSGARSGCSTVCLF